LAGGAAGPRGDLKSRRGWSPRPARGSAWIAAALGWVVLLGPSAALALTGVEWRRLGPAARAAYVTGVVDAWQGLVAVQESVGSPDAGITVFAEIVTCLRERLLAEAQIAAAVEKYVAENPGQSGKDMTDLVFAALSRDCSR
jgi:hypothetical protein